MKKSIAAIAVLLLSAALLFSCTGSNTETPPEQNDEQETVSEEQKADIIEYLSQFTIVRSDISTKAEKDAAVELRTLLTDFGADVGIETDWVKKGEEMKRFGLEILVGKTNRDESLAMKDEFESSDERLDYILRKVGDHYVIYFDDDCASDAINVFFSEITSKNISDEINMMRVHEYPIKSFSICGRDINDFSYIRYPSYYNKEQVDDVSNISDLIYEATGAKLEAAEKDNTTSGSILLGTDLGLSGLDYAARYENGSLSIGGSNYYADMRALYQVLIYGGMGLDCEGNYNGNTELKESDLPSGIVTFKTKPDVIMSAWMTSGNAVEREIQIKEAADANFNLVNIAYPGTNESANAMMKWCAVYDLCIMWTNGSVVGNYTSEDFPGAGYYADVPHVWGDYLCDEPNSTLFGMLDYAYRNYKAQMPDKEPFINLFPMYANEQQLGNPTYQQHIDEFMETVNPEVVSVDIYPCNTSGLYDGYMKNLDICATAARKYNRLYSVYIQSVSFASSKRTPSKVDMEWQSWCCLSFGARSIIYFTYMTPYSSAENFSPALIDHDLQKTEGWYGAQTVNGEIAKVAPVIASYKNLGAFNYKYTGTVRTAYLQFDNQYDFSSVIADVKCDNPLLFGAFEKDGKYAFSCVNMTDLQLKSGGKSDVSVKTDAPVTIWQKGESSTLTPDDNGYVSFTLELGQGVFCEIG